MGGSGPFVVVVLLAVLLLHLQAADAAGAQGVVANLHIFQDEDEDEVGIDELGETGRDVELLDA